MRATPRRLRKKWSPLREIKHSERRHAAHACPAWCDEVWQNDRYLVLVARSIPSLFGRVDHLLVRRVDNLPIRDWYHLQKIKNEVCGPERAGFEVFPAESELVDRAHFYHLWVLEEGASFANMGVNL
ncbi:MAG TPA: hypothetical protein VK054_11675 [Beutenbergiaceae bacterium]|nr:hypothetical protein [Beutenbergiaceae bacterium]